MIIYIYGCNQEYWEKYGFTLGICICRTEMIASIYIIGRSLVVMRGIRESHKNPTESFRDLPPSLRFVLSIHLLFEANIFPIQALHTYYELIKTVTVAGFVYFQESAKQFSSTVGPHLKQMMEHPSIFVVEKIGMAKTWLSTIGQMQDHQIILLCMIFCLCGLISLLKIIHFIVDLRGMQPSDGSLSRGEQEDQKNYRKEDTPEGKGRSTKICEGDCHL